MTPTTNADNLQQYKNEFLFHCREQILALASSNYSSLQINLCQKYQLAFGMLVYFVHFIC